jgi:hypothetical protein
MLTKSPPFSPFFRFDIALKHHIICKEWFGFSLVVFHRPDIALTSSDRSALAQAKRSSNVFTAYGINVNRLSSPFNTKS